MCNGTLMDKLISFSIPLMLSGILQLMFNAVDIIVVGRFAGSESLAAVGSTTALINVFTNLFIGISLGSNVLAARYYAAGKEREMSETVHSSLTLALISGILMAFAGLFFSRTALEWMGTPDDVIDLAALYMKIYFIGMPFFMLYNYGAAILRAVGDTKRPLLFLVVSGLVNAGLNMIFVICFHMAVEGVAIATVISQLLSCIMVLICLYRTQGCYQFRFRSWVSRGSMSSRFSRSESRQEFRAPSSTFPTSCCSPRSIPLARLQWQDTPRRTISSDFYTLQSTL